MHELATVTNGHQIVKTEVAGSQQVAKAKVSMQLLLASGSSCSKLSNYN